MADDGEAARVFAQPARQEGESARVEMVGRLVEQQHVVVRAEQAREADAVALADRQRRQRTVAVGAGAQRREGDVDAAFGVPGVEPGGGVERGGVAVVGGRVALGEGEGRLVQGRKRRERGGQRLGREGADGLAVAGGQLLAGQADRAGPVHGALVRREQPGEDVQEGRLAAAVLADDGGTGPGGHGERDAVQDAP